MGFGLFFLGAGALISAGCYILNKLTEKEREFQRYLRRGIEDIERELKGTAEEYKNRAKEELIKEYRDTENQPKFNIS